jgi:hypothetical protein
MLESNRDRVSALGGSASLDEVTVETESGSAQLPLPGEPAHCIREHPRRLRSASIVQRWVYHHRHERAALSDDSRSGTSTPLRPLDAVVRALAARL